MDKAPCIIGLHFSQYLTCESESCGPVRNFYKMATPRSFGSHTSAIVSTPTAGAAEAAPPAKNLMLRNMVIAGNTADEAHNIAGDRFESNVQLSAEDLGGGGPPGRYNCHGCS